MLTQFADLNVAIYEKDSGGEAVELGLLRHEYCFTRTVVLPRDYYGTGQSTWDTKDDVLEHARHIALADDLDDAQKKTELRGLLASARDAGITITEHELTEYLDAELAKRTVEDPAYSWVHLALFRRLEQAGRCHTWHSESELRDLVKRIARDSPTEWQFE